MKKMKTLSLFLLASILTISCSSNDDSKPEPLPNPVPTENIWKLDNYNYARRVSNQSTSVQGNFTIVNIDSNIATANSPYTNCNLVITFNTSSIGDYTVKTQNTMFTNSTLKYMHIRCQIASGNGTGAVYDSTDSNIMANVALENGKFIITIPNGAILTRTSNDGMVNPPNNFTLTAQKVQ